MSATGPLTFNHARFGQWRQWDDTAILYDSRSGDTHLLSGIAAALVGRLAGHSAGLSHDQLQAALQQFDLQSLPAVIDQLCLLGIVAPFSASLASPPCH
ncbi:MAG TPA: HPr-rel-A system PqqD family peptide chaperone [Pseudomonadales bacterium]|jgi:PqqD family protein of HPr-rel-A system|nr:HPr-rel-A system PqqD family peptide chaperone [Pseudomonadales bacterium]HMW14418.1 HPr-rel-A system PqqD family peptide chaperone [Pseudomonadales bacterium]HMZ71436.1 HPr-rel-A system PqqD family peptide chaperone [Pseudomonadales bacterium]HNB83220.1 HPr-rel-A system PqqD family peptide chaperone [Pseudomonadales bacterium]HNI64259.1 HPr-rel-A system PqqD family peptide chaperone [Pseudomonadales bacterium]